MDGQEKYDFQFYILMFPCYVSLLHQFDGFPDTLNDLPYPLGDLLIPLGDLLGPKASLIESYSLTI